MCASSSSGVALLAFIMRQNSAHNVQAQRPPPGTRSGGKSRVKILPNLGARLTGITNLMCIFSDLRERRSGIQRCNHTVTEWLVFVDRMDGCWWKLAPIMVHGPNSVSFRIAVQNAKQLGRTVLFGRCTSSGRRDDAPSRIGAAAPNTYRYSLSWQMIASSIAIDLMSRRSVSISGSLSGVAVDRGIVAGAERSGHRWRPLRDAGFARHRRGAAIRCSRWLNVSAQAVPMLRFKMLP